MLNVCHKLNVTQLFIKKHTLHFRQNLSGAQVLYQFTERNPFDVNALRTSQAYSNSLVYLLCLKCGLLTVPLDSKTHKYSRTLDSRESYKRNFIRSEINTTTYLQTKRFLKSIKRNKGNKTTMLINKIKE